MTEPSTPPAGISSLSYRKPEPFLTLRTYILIVASLLVTLLFVHEYRRQQGPCRTQFKPLHSMQTQTNRPHLLRVQDDANPGEISPPTNPCSNPEFFGVTLQQGYAALTLVLWGVTGFYAAQDISFFRKDRRRRRMRLAYLAEIESQSKERQGP